MEEVISVRTMRESDAHTIENYVPSKELMYRAAMGVYRAVSWNRGAIGILTGAGNNGGDGYALACILADNGFSCRVYRVSEKFSEDGKYYYDMAVSKGVETVPFSQDADLSHCDILVDCILGTGFSGQVRGLPRAAIEAINKQTGAYVVSVDINSGLNGDSGEAELAVKADLTVTIGYLKTGFFLKDAAQYVQQLVVADIGIRLIREDYYLASPEEIVFPQSGLALAEAPKGILPPEEAEGLLREGQTIPELVTELAREKKGLIRFSGETALISDGYRTYFIAEGVLPKVIRSLGGE